MILDNVSAARSASLSRGSNLAVESYQSERVSFPAHLNHFQDLWACLELSLTEMGLGEKHRWRWYLTALELVNNAISHGSNSDPSREIVVSWAVIEGQLELRVKDEGNGPPDRFTRSPRLPDDLTQQRGRGLYLVHNFSDSWEHWRSESSYCCVVRKRLAAPLQAELSKHAAPFESFERSVSELSAFYQLGAAILHQDAPGTFVEKGIEHLVGCLHARPKRVSVILSERLHCELSDAFDGHTYLRSIADAPEVVLQVLRGGRGVDWADGCCHPIVANEMNLGCLLVEVGKEGGLSMTESGQTRVFADLFGIAIDHYRLRKECHHDEQFRRETEFATRIQRELLHPRELPPSPYWEIVHRSAAHSMVAGDFQESCYDREGNLIMVIIDVMGKGATAAIFAFMFRTALHARLQSDFDLEEFLESFNNTLHDWLGGDTRFITCSIVKVDAARTTLEVINAGHCPALLFSGGELVCQQHATGPPLGIFADCHYVSERRELYSVDTILIVSDDVFEWFEGENVWGWENFVDFAKTTLPFGYDTFWNSFQERINRSVEDRTSLDDQTLLWWNRSALAPETSSTI